MGLPVFRRQNLGHDSVMKETNLLHNVTIMLFNMIMVVQVLVRILTVNTILSTLTMEGMEMRFIFYSIKSPENSKLTKKLLLKNNSDPTKR